MHCIHSCTSNLTRVSCPVGAGTQALEGQAFISRKVSTAGNPNSISASSVSHSSDTVPAIEPFGHNYSAHTHPRGSMLRRVKLSVPQFPDLTCDSVTHWHEEEYNGQEPRGGVIPAADRRFKSPQVWHRLSRQLCVHREGLSSYGM